MSYGDMVGVTKTGHRYHASSSRLQVFDRDGVSIIFIRTVDITSVQRNGKEVIVVPRSGVSIQLQTSSVSEAKSLSSLLESTSKQEALTGVPSSASRHVAVGTNGVLTITDTTIVINRQGGGNVFLHGKVGTKEILIAEITATQFLASSRFGAGYIQFLYPGSQDLRGGIFEATRDENTVMFNNQNEASFRVAKEIVDRRREELRMPRASQEVRQTPVSSPFDDIERLAELRDKGIVTQEEFEAKKRQILGI